MHTALSPQSGVQKMLEITHTRKKNLCEMYFEDSVKVLNLYPTSEERHKTMLCVSVSVGCVCT